MDFKDQEVQTVTVVDRTGHARTEKISQVLGFHGLNRMEVDSASAGDIVAFAGLSGDYNQLHVDEQFARQTVHGGRIAAHEIMLGTAAIRNLIREDKVHQIYSAMQTGAAAGMQTLDSCLQGLVRRGVISVQEARANARSPEAF